MASHTGEPVVPAPSSRMHRKVALASAVGTSIEWYDYHVYSVASALVIGRLFFTEMDPYTATLAAFATFAIGFVARPLGGVLAGHLGDRVGRKQVMVLTLSAMGAATTLIGLLPTYAQIGVWAPVLLVALRLLQGLSAGGEWGGAALMAVEHAPAGRRGVFGNFVQLGTPAGMFLANSVMLLLVAVMPQDAFESWGWRVPFLLSVVMVVIGFVIRRAVEESPSFRSVRAAERTARLPVVDVVRRYPGRIALAIASFVGNNAVGYLFLAFLPSYGTGTLGLSRGFMLAVLLVGCVSWFAAMIGFAAWSDRIGRHAVYLTGYGIIAVWAFPFFALLRTGEASLVVVAVVVLTLGLAATYGPQAALFAELFPAEVRTSGASLSYALGAALSGGIAPLVATALQGWTGTVYSVSVFMIGFAALSSAAVLALRRIPSSFDTPASNEESNPEGATTR
ncbi:MFS transporter [Pseudonocardia sp. MH-G8]|uniref:MFS transporter n=1 Tax=Pseudonocardia sp. MH-G8 TaxID=1854588 RepID=UPI000BA050A3|nr:MFS transporter [Pseudonocardia sp. MH-G8]OZM76791.1 MFS transporter [Pseudonocardia sp. MH-G8]